MFSEKILTSQSGAILYGITPPKEKTPPERLSVIAKNRSDRINSLSPDALIVYDIQDESSRTDQKRPFEFFPTLDPLSYADGSHRDVLCEKIIYHVAGKYTPAQLKERIAAANESHHLSVYVGAATKESPSRCTLSQAYELWRTSSGKGLTGGVTIPERHHSKKTEHLRVADKQRFGCSFFVSQCICNINLVKNFISDYCALTEELQMKRAYLIFTLSLCGNLETLRLMRWLGIDVPDKMEDQLTRSVDVLEESIRQNEAIAFDLANYCKAMGVCCGFNIESISPKIAEIEATVVLTNLIKKF